MNKQLLSIAMGVSLTLLATQSVASIKDECESSGAGLHASEVCPVIKVMIDQFAAFSPPATFVETNAIDSSASSLDYTASSRPEEKEEDDGFSFGKF